MDKQTLGDGVLQVWFDPSGPLRTTLMDKQTLGEGVLQVFGVVRPLRTTLIDKQTLGEGVLQVYGVVQSLRTSSKYTNGAANTCSTGVRCGSIPLILVIQRSLK